jgi:hypothetical protein
MLLEGISSRDEDDIRVQAILGQLGRANTGEVLFSAHHLLAGKVATAFVLDLVLDVEPSHASLDVLLNGLGHHQGSCN